MKKLLFTAGIASIEALGTVTRLISIADEVVKYKPDTKILFRAEGREADYVKCHGYDVIGGYRPYLYGLPSFIGKKIGRSDMNRAVPNIKSVVSIIKLKGLINKEYINKTFEEEMKLVYDFQPDCIIGEFDLVMPIVSKKTGISFYCTGSTPVKKNFIADQFPKDKSGEKYAKEYNKLLTNIKLPKIIDVSEMLCEYYAEKVIVPSIFELEELPKNSHYMYTGSLIPENFSKSNFKWNKKRPLIYVYLSSSQVAPQHYEKVMIEAFAKSEFDVIVTAGGHSYFKKKGDYKIGNVYFYQIIPTDQIMKFVDIAIHHGGQNSTVQCIMNKIPALIFAGKHFERHFNAKKAEEIGCAINIKTNKFNKEYLLKTCTDLIDKKPYQENLLKYSNMIKNAGGAKKAAKQILGIYK